MNNVDDLKRTMSSAPTQTISLNALRNENTQPSVNIDTTNGVSGIAEEETQRPAIRISSNRVKPTRRTIMNDNQVNTVNPNDFIDANPNKPEPNPTMQENALNMLDQTVRRKQQEYNDFINKALADDELHRERIEDGLETVNGDVDYVPETVREENNKEDTPKATAVKKPVDTDEYIDDVESDIEAEIFGDEKSTLTTENTTHIVSSFDPFSSDNNTKAYFDHPNDLPKEKSYLDETITTSSQEVDEESEDIGEEVALVEKPVVEEKKPEKKVDDNEFVKIVAANSVTVSSNVIDNADTINSSETSDFNLAEEDFEDVTVDTSSDGEKQLTDEEIRDIALESAKNLRNEVLQKIINADKRLNTSSFVVSNKVISIKDAIKGTPSTERTATYPMMYAGRPFKASALKGPDIALLADNDDTETDNPVGLTIEQARILYEHDANEYKPKTVEGWAKTIPFADIESIFVALYIASLKGANYVPLSCTKPSCAYSFLSDDTDINKMIKFKNDNVKKRFEEIKKVAITPENTGKYDSVVSVINNKFAVGLKVPSIYTVLYEYASLNAPFIRKYSSVISIMEYIDYIYMIDPETEQFMPIGWKTYPGDHGKTFRSKIATYAKIIKEFDDTDFSVLIALINSMIIKNSDEKDITYEIPANKCPKCGTDIPARPILPRHMVFMRQRLVASATTPLER